MAVLFILSLILTLVFPSINISQNVHSEAKKMASILRYIKSSCIAKKEILKMKVILKEKTIIYDGYKGVSVEKFQFLDAVETTTKGIITDSELDIFFNPTGMREELKFYFYDGKEKVFVVYNPFSNQVKIKNEQKN